MAKRGWITAALLLLVLGSLQRRTIGDSPPSPGTLNSEDYDTGGYIVSDLVTDNTNGSWTTMKDLISRPENLSYDVMIRPKQQQFEAVDVNLTFHLNAIVDLSTVSQKLDVMGYFYAEWNDEIIPWDPVLWGGINTIILPKSSLWYPRLVIDKSYGQSGVIGDTTDMLKVNADGSVIWAPNGIYSLICAVKTMFYPLDVQTCEMDLYVSDQTVSRVNLQYKKDALVFVTKFTENVEWKLTNVSSFTRQKYDTNFVTIRMIIERRSSFIVYTTILPLFTLSLLSVTSYLVPVQSGEKVGLTITIFLAYGFFVAVTRDSIPPDSLKTPYIVQYISAMLILSMVSVVYVMIESKIFTEMRTKSCRIRCPKLNITSPFSNLHIRRRKVESNLINRSRPKTNDRAICIDVAESRKKRSDRNLTGKTSVSMNRATKESMREEKEPYSWGDFLSHADIFMFIANCIVLLILNAVIWGLAASRTEG